MAATSLLVLKSDFNAHQDMLWQGTATGGSTSSLTDTTLKSLVSETWPTLQAGSQIRITSGASSGDIRLCTDDTDRVHGIIYPNADFSSTGPTNGDTYELWGSGIHGGPTLTRLFNDVLRRLRPITQTQLTIVTNQTIYDISSSVAQPEDVIDVYLRSIDPANQRPYTPVPVPWWNAFRIAGIGGTAAVELDIRPPLTSTDTTIQLWLEHHKAFTAFVDDTSTVDAVYRDWVVWETILEFAGRRSEQPLGDRSVWQTRAKRALAECVELRARFLPRHPIRLRPAVPG